MSDARVSRQTMIGELLQIDEDIAPILLGIGMHCLGCPSSQMETIEEAAAVHGINPDDLVEEINNFLASKQESYIIAKLILKIDAYFSLPDENVGSIFLCICMKFVFSNIKMV